MNTAILTLNALLNAKYADCPMKYMNHERSEKNDLSEMRYYYGFQQKSGTFRRIQMSVMWASD